MAALEVASALGIDGVEIDVMVTKDNVVVLFHDESLERLTGDTSGLSIADMTYDQVSKLRILKRLDATGNGGFQEFESDQPIPLLEDVLYKFTDLKIEVEMKAYRPRWERRHWGREVAKVIRKCDAADRVIVASYDFFMLNELEKEYPGLHSGFAYDDGMSDSLAVAADQWFTKEEIGKPFEARDSKGFVRWLAEEDLVGRAVGATIVGIEWTVFDANTVEKFHNRGYAVGAYVFYPYDVTFVQQQLTEEEEERVIRRLVKQGVDWMETDDPEKLMKLLKKIESES